MFELGEFIGRIVCEGGFDFLYGEEDSDYLDGGADAYRDVLVGGRDHDTFVSWSDSVDELMADLGKFDTIKHEPGVDPDLGPGPVLPRPRISPGEFSGKATRR